MVVVTRYLVPEAEVEEFRVLGREAVEALSRRPGCAHVRFGRNADDPRLWLLTSRWRNVGDYRRALSHPEVKLRAVPLMYRCIDEPSAFEELITWDAAGGLAEHASDLA